MEKKSKLLFWLIPLILILLGFVFYDYVYVAIEEKKQSLDELKELKTRTLEKYVNAIAQKGALEYRINAFKELRKIEEAGLMEGQTPSVAAANLQNIVKEIIAGKGGTVSSERAEKAEELGRFKVITVSIDSILPETRALSDILYLLGAHRVTLLIREIDVRIRNMREPRELMVNFRVSAMNMSK
jgi:hypothetical protein